MKCVTEVWLIVALLFSLSVFCESGFSMNATSRTMVFVGVAAVAALAAAAVAADDAAAATAAGDAVAASSGGDGCGRFGGGERR